MTNRTPLAVAASVLLVVSLAGCHPSPSPLRDFSAQSSESTISDVSPYADVPADLSFEAGADLAASDLPTFSSTILTSPGWSAASDAATTGGQTFVNSESGCTLVVNQALSVSFAAGELADDEATMRSLSGLLGSATPEFADTLTIPGNDGAISVEGIGVPVRSVTGGAGYLYLRSFGAAGIEMVVILSCEGEVATSQYFIETVVPFIRIDFLDE